MKFRVLAENSNFKNHISLWCENSYLAIGKSVGSDLGVVG
jgi:hypothetical protein